MGKKKNVDLSMTEDTVKVVEAVEPTAESVTVEVAVETESEATEGQADQNAEQAEKKAAKKAARTGRSHKYQAVRAQVDKTKEYDTTTAVELVKKLSYSKFPGTISAHIQTKKDNITATLSFPHSTGKKIQVAIVSPEVLEKIEQNQIEFDVLLAKPADMPKITKFARVLGPKGLMPNPKVGTLVDDPEARKKELEGGKMTIKTEKKAPLMHVSLGKTNMEATALVENLEALLKAIKDDISKVHIAATMSPSVRVKVE